MPPTTRINWKSVASSVVSALTILAALPYSLGELSAIIPVEWKPRIVGAGLLATVALRIWNAATTASVKIEPQPEPKP